MPLLFNSYYLVWRNCKLEYPKTCMFFLCQWRILSCNWNDCKPLKSVSITHKCTIFFLSCLVSVALQLITHLVRSLYFLLFVQYVKCIVVLNYVLVTCFINKWWLWKCLNIQVNQPSSNSFCFAVYFIRQKTLQPPSPFFSNISRGYMNEDFTMRSVWLRLISHPGY